MSANEVIKAIKRYSKFLITSHIDLEADALGSELALASLLKKLGKTVYIINDNRAPSNCSFLPGVKRIRHKLNSRKTQVAFIIDCANKQRIGKVADLIGNEKLIINIDHHIGNKNFGKINWVNPKASSTGEMIYHLFRLTATKLDKNDALNLYAAILTDTGSFRYSNTTSVTHYICSKLLKFGIEPAKVYAQIYENNSAQDVVLVARIISRMSFGAKNKIAWAKINRYIFKKVNDSPEILDKILDFAKSIKTVKVVIIFSQIDDRLVKLSLRSKSPINVQKIAQVYSGGGHRYASGCTIKGNLKEVEQMVLKEVKKVLNTSDY